MPRIAHPSKIDPSDAEARVMLLRGALHSLLNNFTTKTRVGMASRDFAYKAYVASLSVEERAIVLVEAQSRDETIKTYEEAMFRYGTTLIVELQERNLLETPPSP